MLFIELRLSFSGGIWLFSRRCVNGVQKGDAGHIKNMLTSQVLCEDTISSLIRNINEGLRRPQRVEFQYVCREANTCADLLANEGVKLSQSKVSFDQVPRFLLDAVKKDFMSTCSIRRSRN